MSSQRIMSEFQIILNLSTEDTQKKLDKALKRNLEGQQKSPIISEKKIDPQVQSDEVTSEIQE